MEWFNYTSKLKPKDMVPIPWMVAMALQQDGWYLRADIIWGKPNPMPESVTDRPTKAHEYVFLLTRSPRYFFDQEAVREPAEWARWGDQTNRKHEGAGGAAGWIGSKSKEELQQRRGPTWEERKAAGAKRANRDPENVDASAVHMPGQSHTLGDGRGRNVRSVWEIATQPYPQAHFATFPEELARRCIAAGTSERGCCPECGAPWERETVPLHNGGGEKSQRAAAQRVAATGGAITGGTEQSSLGSGFWARETTGWRPTCECNHTSVPCVVLDPFGGSGTTALVARRLGRRAILIELSPEYAALAADRTRQLSLLAGEASA